jgi:hypothetical protein
MGFSWPHTLIRALSVTKPAYTCVRSVCAVGGAAIMVYVSRLEFGSPRLVSNG